MWGNKPGGHHFTNVILHAANTLLLFLIFSRLTGALWRSAFVAALFAVHPLHVESVAWVAERKDVLSTFFGLLAIWFYIKYAREPSPKAIFAHRLSIWSRRSCEANTGQLSLHPFLLDIWPLRPMETLANRRSNRRSVSNRMRLRIVFCWRNVPLLIIGAVFSIVALISQRRAQNLAVRGLLPLSTRGANAIVGYLFIWRSYSLP